MALVPVQNYQTYLSDLDGCEFHRNTVNIAEENTPHSLLLCVSEFVDMINCTFVGKQLSNFILVKVSLEMGGVRLQQRISVL